MSDLKQTVMQRLEALKARQAANKQSAKGVEKDLSSEESQNSIESATEHVIEQLAKGVNPPEPQKANKEVPKSPSQDTTPSSEGEVCPSCGQVFKRLGKHRCKAVIPLNESPAPAPEPEQESKPKPPPEPEQESKPKPVPASKRQDISEQEVAKFPNYELFINCVVAKNNGGLPVIHFEDLIHPICKAVASNAEADHWSLIPYGQGPGSLSRALEVWLGTDEASKIIDGALLVVNARTPEARACLHILQVYANDVIIGTF